MQFDNVRADRVTAVILFAIGVAMIYGGFTMDRLEIRRIHPASIPGLVPMGLGAVLALCAVLLFASARDATPAGGAISWKSVVLTLALCVVYAVGLVGSLPFFLATAAFVSVFVAIFASRDRNGSRSLPRTIAFSIVFGLVVAGAISWLFRYGFLVRLP